MPTPTNVDAPVILIGAGRSGTSLVSRIFDLHPDCISVGETVNLIFGPWQAVALSSASISPLVEGDAWVSEDERAARVVRQTFLTCFPDTRRHWMQKPIGIPKAVSEKFDDVASPEAGAYYWRVMTTAFPRARYVAILRHPCDVVLSGRSKWGFSDRSLWRTLATLSGYLTHPDSPVRHVVRYEALVAHPESTVRAMCDAMEIPFDAAMLAGFDEVHVPAPGREDPSQSGYSRRDEWAALDPLQISPAQRRAITAAFDRFSTGIEWPAHFDAPVAPSDAAAAAAPATSEVAILRAQVRQLSTSVERAMFEHAEELRRRDEAWQTREREFFADLQAREHAFADREKELTALWSEQQAWIAELERVKTWLQAQVEYFRIRAQG